MYDNFTQGAVGWVSYSQGTHTNVVCEVELQDVGVFVLTNGRLLHNPADVGRILNPATTNVLLGRINNFFLFFFRICFLGGTRPYSTTTVQLSTFSYIFPATTAVCFLGGTRSLPLDLCIYSVVRTRFVYREYISKCIISGRGVPVTKSLISYTRTPRSYKDSSPLLP